MMAKAFVFMRKKAVVYATDETIEQIAKDYEEAMKEAAEAMKGKPSPNKGKHFSEETRNKMSEANKGKHTGSDNPFYGKRHSEETRRKISEAFKGCHWYNNGKINKLCYECPPGFVPGRLK